MISYEIMKAVFDLNLEPIKVKLMHQQSGEGWSLAKVNVLEVEYKRFLCLMKAYPAEQTAPTEEVDIFWHYHILDTIKYAADCEAAFGYFLHHFPYVGMRGDDDVAALARMGERMGQLYEAAFGVAYGSMADDGVAHAGSGGAAFCSRIPPRTTAFSSKIAPSTTAFCSRIPPRTAAFCSATAPQTTAFCSNFGAATAAFYSPASAPMTFKTPSIAFGDDRPGVAAALRGPSIPHFFTDRPTLAPA